MRRGQAAVEFLVLAGFMLFVFSTFFLVVQQRAQVAAEQEVLEQAASVAGIITNEVLIAQRVRPGYERTFRLPLLIDDRPYNITVVPPATPSEVVITYAAGAEYVVFLSVNLTSGSSMAPGDNVIRKPAPGDIGISPAP